MSHSECSCPRCKSESSVVDYWTLFLSIEEWPCAIFVLSVIAIASQMLTLSAETSALFAIFSVAPVLFLITRRKTCMECGIEFDAPVAATVRTSRRRDYERF